MSVLVSAAIGAVLAYGAIALYLYFGQRRLIYPRDPTAVEPEAIDGRWPLSIQTVAADGVACRHLWWPPDVSAGGEEQSTVVAVFHGNAGHVGHRIEKFAPLAEAGHGLLLVGYRGYGGNPGKPDQPGLLADAEAALEWLQSESKGRPIVLYGESLGAAVAVQETVAGRGQGVVLECPFDRLSSPAARRYPWLPVRGMLKDPWDSLAVIAQVRQPLLWLHGSDDQLTPLELGERLYAEAPEPKQRQIAYGGGHCDFLDRPEVLTTLLAFLRSVAEASKSPKVPGPLSGTAAQP